MGNSRLEKLAPLSGLLAVVMLVVSAILINRFDYLPEASDIGAFLERNSAKVAFGGYVGLVAAALLIWFAGSLRSYLNRLEGDDGRGGALAFGAGVGVGVLFAGSYSTIAVAAARAGTSGGVTDPVAAVLYDLYSTVAGAGVAVVLTVMLAAYAGVGFRTRAIPTWLIWVSVFFAVGSVSPLSYVFVGADFLWIAYVSVAMYRAGLGEPAT